MNNYDGIFIMKPDEKEAEKVIGDIKKFISDNKGKVESEENWGKRELAFRIKKCREGVYYKVNFSIDPLAIRILDDHYRISQDVLRAMFISKDKR